MSEHFSDDSLVWSRFGRCDTADPELFFPQVGADNSLAKSICQACPVRRQCLDHALETKQKYGIWGGMTEAQRRRLRRDSRASHPARPRTADNGVAPAPAVIAVATGSTDRSVVISRGHLTLVR